MLLFHPDLLTREDQHAAEATDAAGREGEGGVGGLRRLLAHARDSTAGLMERDWEQFSHVHVVFGELLKCLQYVF